MLLVSHDRALLDAVAERTARDRGPARCDSYDGGWADYVRRRDERAAAESSARIEPPPPKPGPKPTPKPTPRKPQRPRELQQLEAEIEAKERAVADLERRLADDWADVDAVAAYRRAREELEALFARWETLVESAQA